MVKDHYEISVWEDFIVPVTFEEGTTTVIAPSYFKERKIGVIGSDTITSQNAAFSPTLTCNVNGTSTLTFQLHYSYIDNETGENVKNPWVSLLVNERKIKVLWKGKWYDMVIKSIVESSDKHTITYTCKDAFINELSKNGFSLEFDGELQNNTGTINELAAAILEGTDWKLGEETILNQTLEEPVYEVEVISGFTAKDAKGTDVEIKEGSSILVFYSCVTNQEPFCQFWYDESGVYKTETTNQLALNGSCCALEGVSWEKETDKTYGTEYLAAYLGETVCFKVNLTNGVSDNYRAERLVRKQKTVVDPKLDRTVNVYTVDGKEYYGYSEVEYKSPTVVNSIVASGENFSASSSGWSGGSYRSVLYPDWTKAETLTNAYTSTSHLLLEKNVNYLNRGVKNCISYIPDGFQVGDKWILRYKARTSDADNSAPIGDDYISAKISAYIGYYTEDTSGSVITYSPKDGGNYFKIVDNPQKKNDGWNEATYQCITGISKSEISKATRFNFLFKNEGTADIWIEKIEFFPYIEGVVYEEVSTGVSSENYQNYYVFENDIYDKPDSYDSSKTYYEKTTRRINPGEMDAQSIAQIYYRYYDPTTTYSSADDLTYTWSGTEKNPDYIPYYGSNDNTYEKVRTITGKESNRFNLIQNLCETFECWAVFETEHNPATGEIIYDEKGCPKKTVSFREEIGERTGLGFIYGIDLKTIQRTINSDQIVSKTIVKPNSNEFAENGFCTIARAQDNYSKEAFVLDFGYYTSQGLLNGGQLNKDLYLTTSDSIGYYYYLNQYNTAYDAITTELAAKNTELTKQQAFLTTYSEYLNSAAEQLATLEARIMSLASKTTLNDALEYAKENPDYTSLNSAVQSRFDVIQNYNNMSALVEKLGQSVAQIEYEIAVMEDQQEDYKAKIAAKHEEFWNKYSSYIQEGVWTSEDYVDDELYYLDACSVAYTSARPQTTYSISVLRLSALEEFKNKIFNLGDICYIQDTDFFGYTQVDNVRTPYKEEVFVSEITSYFDTPDKDTFKVQNYKTQFEDLFQRITATTQSLQYASGSYAKAAALVDSTGTLTYETLQTAFARNGNIVQAAQNETITQDETGITLINANNPNEMLKLTSMGILLTTDGGVTWKTGVRGSGISTEYLTAGNINADVITILNNGMPQYRWDANGITAYWVQNGNLWLNKFIRHDQFGLYGVSNFNEQDEQGTTKFESEDAIWDCDATRFALTWKGFLLRNSLGNGSIEINSEKNQILVQQDGTDVITLGRLDSTGKYYGLQFKNSGGDIVLETGTDGNLWLKNALYIGSGDSTNVAIGNLGADDTGDNRVFKAGVGGTDNFIVYENGKIVARDAVIYGEIHATGGQIGNLSIATLPETLGIRIQESNGDTFKVSNGVVAPNELTFTIKTSIEGASSPVWFTSPTMEFGKAGVNTDTLTLDYSDISSLFQNGICYLKAEVSAGGTTYDDIISLKLVSDGTNGKDGEKGADGADGKDGTSYYVHIRYSANADGSNFTTTPTSSTIYIGVYSGTSETAPINANAYEWTEIKGADGENAPEVKAQYSADGEGWHSTFVDGDQYVRFSYDGGETYGDAIKVVGADGKQGADGQAGADGTDANQFMITTGQEEVLKFAENVDGNDNLTFSFSPETLVIQLRDGRNADASVDNFFLASEYKIELSVEGVNIIEQLGDNAATYVNCSPTFGDEDDETSTAYYFHLSELYKAIPEDQLKEKRKLEGLDGFYDILNGSSAIPLKIKVSLTIDGEYNECFKWLSIKNGLSDDMARLSLKANGIYAAIQKAGFNFSANGLTITNGNFAIEYTNTSNEKITGLYFNNTNGSLKIAGSLISGGTLEGVNGDFTGKITAEEGLIGGFTIANNALISQDGELRLVGGTDTESSQIEVDNIVIGTGAVIKDYIQLGSDTNKGQVRLMNPDENDGIAIKTWGSDGNPSLTIERDGTISVLGGNNVIQSSYNNETGDYYWQLSKNMAKFQNGYFSGSVEAATISASTIITQVFKALQTQAMGGSFIFRPSTRDIEITNNEDGVCQINFLDEDFRKTAFFKQYDAILLQYVDYNGVTQKVQGYVSNEPQSSDNIGPASIDVKFDKEIEYSRIDSLIYLGGANNNIIGINSENSAGGTASFLSERALSMTELVYDSTSGQWSSTKRLILGDLGANRGEIAALRDETGYGLYADNVILNGKLFTHSVIDGIEVSAGIDSKSNYGPVSRSNDPIIFWAGAKGITKDDIQNAPFIVTRDGYIYATRGNFSNGLIVNSTIEGAEIHSAIIDGAGDGSDGPSLVIYDTNIEKAGVQFRKWKNKEFYAKVEGEADFQSGINYYELQSDGTYVLTEDEQYDALKTYYRALSNNERYEDTLAITSSGLYRGAYSKNSSPFVDLSNSNALVYRGTTYQTEKLCLGATSLSYETKAEDGTIKNGATIELSDTVLTLFSNLQVGTSLVKSTAARTQLTQTVFFGDDNGVLMEYRKDSTEGYSLYVSST